MKPTLTTQTERRAVLGAEHIDSILGLAILVAVNLFWFRDNIGFIGVSPHPYWLAILPIAARHGFRAGASVGLLCGVTLVLMLKLGQPDLGLWAWWSKITDPVFLNKPFLFIVMGMILGEISETQKKKNLELAGQYNDLKDSHEALSKRYEELGRAKEELDTHIISQEQTMSTFYEAAQALRSLEEEAIYPAVGELLRDFMSVEASSIYLLLKDTLVLAGSMGAVPGRSRLKKENPDKGLMGLAITTGRPVSIQTLSSCDDRTMQEINDAGIIISAPLLNSDNQTLGLLNIEKLPFLKFNPQTIRMTSLMAEWCGSAIQNARTYKISKDKNISDEITGAYTYQYCFKRLEEELIRARRYHYPCSVLILEIVAFNIFPKGVKEDILMVASSIFQNKLRKDIDLLFHDSDPSRYIIFLPHTPIEGALVAKQRIIREMDAFQFKPFLDEDKLLQIKGGEAEISPDMVDAGDWVRKAFERMPFRTRLNEEIQRSFEDQLPLSVLALEIADFLDFSQRAREDVLTALNGIFLHIQKDIDLIYHDSDPSKYILFLPNFDVDGAQSIGNEIVNEIDAFAFMPYENTEDQLQIKSVATEISEEIRDAEQLLIRALGEL